MKNLCTAIVGKLNLQAINRKLVWIRVSTGYFKECLEIGMNEIGDLFVKVCKMVRTHMQTQRQVGRRHKKRVLMMTRCHCNWVRVNANNKRHAKKTKVVYCLYIQISNTRSQKEQSRSTEDKKRWQKQARETQTHKWGNEWGKTTSEGKQKA